MAVVDDGAGRLAGGVLKVEVVIAGRAIRSGMRGARFDRGDDGNLAADLQADQPPEIIEQLAIPIVSLHPADDLVHGVIGWIHFIGARLLTAVEQVKVFVVFQAVAHQLQADGRHKAMTVGAIRDVGVVLRRRIEHEVFAVLVAVHRV